MSLTPRLDSLESSKNLVINGNFDFWQRGTSVVSGTGTYLADRFVTQIHAAYTVTVSRSTDVPTFTESGFNSQFSLLLTNGTGSAPVAAGYTHINYRMEGYDYQLIHARKVRIQFWTKSSVAGTFAFCLNNNTRSYVTPLVINAANTWEKKVFDIQLDTIAGWSFDNSNALTLRFALTSGSNFQTSTLDTWQTLDREGITGQTQWGATTGATFRLAQVQITPTDFTNSPDVDVTFSRAAKTIQQEFSMCQRYFQRLNPNSDATNGLAYLGGGIVFTTTTFGIPWRPGVPFRATPSLQNTGTKGVFNNAGAMVTLTSFTISTGDPNFLYLSGAVASGIVGGNAAVVGNFAASASDVLFDAEI